MNGDMDFYHLASGFDDPDLVSQQTFRAIVKALDYPGHLVQIKSKFSVPGVLNQASAALFLTLCNGETTVWTDLSWNFNLIDWFQYQCGCSIVTEPCMASLALITEPLSMPPLNQFRIADEEHPDGASTLIVQVRELSANAATMPIAPEARTIASQFSEANLLTYRYNTNLQSNPLFSGIDIFLTCNNLLTALPQ